MSFKRIIILIRKTNHIQSLPSYKVLFSSISTLWRVNAKGMRITLSALGHTHNQARFSGHDTVMPSGSGGFLVLI